MKGRKRGEVGERKVFFLSCEARRVLFLAMGTKELKKGRKERRYPFQPFADIQ